MKVADDWIWTLVLLNRKQPRCQLCHDHCPKLVLFSTRSTQTAPSVNNSVHVIKGRKMKQTHICPIYTLTAKLELNGSVTRLSYFSIKNSQNISGYSEHCHFMRNNRSMWLLRYGATFGEKRLGHFLFQHLVILLNGSIDFGQIIARVGS